MKDHYRDAANAFAKLFWRCPYSLGTLIGIGWGIGFWIPFLFRSDALLVLLVNLPNLLLGFATPREGSPDWFGMLPPLVLNMAIWGALGALVHRHVARRRCRDVREGDGEPDPEHGRPGGGISQQVDGDGLALPQPRGGVSRRKSRLSSMAKLLAALFWHGRYSLGTLVGTALGVAFSLLLFLAPEVARPASLPALALALPFLAVGGMGSFLVGLSVLNMAIWGAVGTVVHFTIVRLARRSSPEQEVGSPGDSSGGDAPARVGKVVKICILATFALLALGGLYWFHRPIPLPRGKATAARITIWAPDDAGTNALGADEELQSYAVSTGDERAVAELASVLRTARANRDHKCGDRGGITLTFATGDVTVDLLPGHTPGYYELRYHNRNYRLAKEPFVRALVECGVAAERIP